MEQDTEPRWVGNNAQTQELLYLAWTLIANAYEGNWKLANREWQSGAIRWREQFHDHLERG